MADNTSGSGVHMSSSGTNVYKQSQISMNSVRMMHEVPFRRLLEALGQSGEVFSKFFYAVICDPPYNTRRFTELSSLEDVRPSL